MKIKAIENGFKLFMVNSIFIIFRLSVFLRADLLCSVLRIGGFCQIAP